MTTGPVRSVVGRASTAGALAILVVMAGASTARTQTLPLAAPPPPSGLFAGASQKESDLVLSGSLLGAYDDDLIAADTNGVPDPRIQQRGSYQIGLTRLWYAHKFAHGEFGMSGTSSLSYYPTLSQIVGVEHGASASGTVRARGLRIQGASSLDYLPLFAFMNAPRLFVTAAGDAGTNDGSAITFDQTGLQRRARQMRTSASVTQSLGRRTEISAWGSLETSDFALQATALTTQSLGARVTRHLTKNLGVVAGLSDQQAQYSLSSGGAQLTRVQSLDAGLDYNGPLGRRRRTTIGFTTGVTAIQDAGGAKPYRLIGAARVTRLIARTWNVTGAYNRGVGFVAGIDRPFFSDSVGLNASGRLSRRLELLFAGSYSKGQIGFVTSNSQTEGFSGSGRLRIAVSRHTAMTAEYLIYHYLFDAGAVPIGIPPSLNRQGARIGFDVWFPISR